MPRLIAELPEEHAPKSMIDLRGDKKTRNVVFFLRMLAIVFFVPLFAGIPLTFRYNSGFDPVMLWELGVPATSWIVPFLMLGVAVYLIAVMHELLHAATLYLVGRSSGTAGSVEFGIDGITPRSHAASLPLTKAGAFLYAIAPFFVVSVGGVVALLLVPDRFVSWVFLPTVAHGVIAASDFVVIAWIVGTPSDTGIAVLADGLVAYGREDKRKKKKRGKKER